MKKPNITEGPWRLLSNDDNWFHITAKDTTSENSLVQVLTWKHGKHPVKECNERWKADAKAISAVPETIDVLMQVHETLHECLEYVSGVGEKYIREDIEQVESALEKSGVEL